ncbi:CsbD family protein [Nocardioides sp. BGMRC 2183]|nr:CsbD family protein [Nocardioides sp. BGMRC 2183]
MGLDDKIKNTADKLSGKAKETEGKATGDEKREAQGKGEQGAADLKQAGEKVKDAFKK